ncbi:DUF2516 family protein [Gordonia zhaorongruii]|uniref:DUF2516 family protein n=1 Tax=Gordonia zhaorongruii TaxID=2597659 RepID=UPI0010540C34|nr:DUF2516 family protein [Gordonia zhaorongruii]
MTVQGLVLDAQIYILWFLTFAAGIPAVIALVHAGITRHDAFTAVDAQSKTFWVAVLAVSVLLIWFGSVMSIWLLFLVGVIASMIYIVDVRVRTDEILNRHWFRKLG